MKNKEDLTTKLKQKPHEIKFETLSKINKKKAETEMKALIDAINHHNELYYNKNKPKISDAEYDRLFERLEKLEKKYPELKSESSPTQKVGAQVKKESKKIKHAKPLLSFQSTQDEMEIKKFIENIHKNAQKTKYIIEPKFDGFSIELVYENGKFSYSATRGDGIEGEDISRNIMTIKALPLNLKDEHIKYLSIRGEVFMTKKTFQKLNKQRVEQNKEAFANPRNAAAGLMRQLDPKKVSKIPFRIVVYEIIDIQGKNIETHKDALDYLKTKNFKTSSKNKSTTKYDEIKEYHNKLEERRETLNYEIDGIVIKVNEYDIREKLGTRERNPRWAIAWKFPPQKEITTINNITMQVGRTGILTPVALLAPVDVGGVTISKATLHNEEYVQKKDFREGDKVKVLRAGDVIPRVEMRVEQTKRTGKKFEMPKRCPVCNTKTVREGAYTLCPNGLSCQAQIKRRLQHFASRNAMNIEGLGERVIEQLVDRSIISNIADIYKLNENDLYNLEGFNTRSAKKLYSNIQNSKDAELDKFIYSLGIRLVGRHIAKVLAKHFNTFENIKNADEKELSKINEIGAEIKNSILHFFQKDENKKVLDELKKQGIKIKSAKGSKSQTLKNLKFVITGELNNYTRDEIKDEIEREGGTTSSSVSKNTDFVIKGDNPGSKLDDAKKQNIKIINEKEFKKMLKK